MLLDQLHAHKDAIIALGSRYGARRIRVFGSVARGEERPESDVERVMHFELQQPGPRRPWAA